MCSNYLYPPLDDKIAKECNEHIETRAPVSAGNVTTTARKICRNIRAKTGNALDLFNVLCTTCESHDLWFVGGGYASYICGKTNKYSDVDIFVCCHGNIKTQAFQNGVISIYCNRNVVSISINEVALQIIQVPFNVKYSVVTSELIDLFSFYVLCNFDLPPCRVGLKYSLYRKSDPYVVDVADIDFTSELAKQHRIEKYASRKVPRLYQPPSLKSLCLFNLFKPTSTTIQ